MTFSALSSNDNHLAAAPNGLWEDPCITLERDLEARAQGGPPNSQFAPSGVLGTMSNQEPNQPGCDSF